MRTFSVVLTSVDSYDVLIVLFRYVVSTQDLGFSIIIELHVEDTARGKLL